MKKERIVFLDYLRVIACFMVMAIHSAEPFYLGGEGTLIASFGDAVWVTLTEVLCRVCVPLFVIASSYLLFPLTGDAWTFFRRRLVKIGVPFLVFSAAYAIWFGGSLAKLAFNFPAEGGHLWFVPMLFGLYLLMPLLSPWAEKVGEKELKRWIALWILTTLFPFARRLWTVLYGEPLFGYGAVPYLHGECPWNPFGAFHYVSGFVGYMLIGLWFRRFCAQGTFASSLRCAVPLWLAGAAITGGGFLLRIPGPYPFSGMYAFAVDLEMSIEYCSLGVVLSTLGAFMVLRHLNRDGALYRLVVRPLSCASFEAYLVHMFILLPAFDYFRPRLSTPLAVLSTAATTFAASMLLCVAYGRLREAVLSRWRRRP